MMPLSSRIFLAGYRGLVGSALHRALSANGYRDVLICDRRELDLTNQAATNDFFAVQRPEYVLLAAARVGGIYANVAAPAQFLRDNLLIQTNVIDAAYRHGAKKLLFLGSSCIYPRHARQPLREDALLTGPLEPTNQAYAVAKIAGVEMCRAYRRQYGFDAIVLMPCNLYGPGDNFDLAGSHVLPALIKRFHDATQEGALAVTVGGTGTPRREFLYVDDFADAALFLMNGYSSDRPINVGTGEDMEVGELARLIASEVGFAGRIQFDRSKPDGAPQKLLDVSVLAALGWAPRISLRDGIRRTHAWYARDAERQSLQSA